MNALAEGPEVSALRAMTLIVRRELRLSFRRPEQVLQPLVFFLIVTTLFPLGLSLQLSLLRDMAPGVLWVAALLSSLLSLDSLFKSDADDGTLEQLALSGQSLTVIVIAKTVALWGRGSTIPISPKISPSVICSIVMPLICIATIPFLMTYITPLIFPGPKISAPAE